MVYLLRYAVLLSFFLGFMSCDFLPEEVCDKTVNVTVNYLCGDQFSGEIRCDGVPQELGGNPGQIKSPLHCLGGEEEPKSEFFQFVFSYADALNEDCRFIAYTDAGETDLPLDSSCEEESFTFVPGGTVEVDR